MAWLRNPSPRIEPAPNDRTGIGTWQQWVEANLPSGTRETSGYRSPEQERALGGPASSYHSRGTVEAPGAIDVGGPADQLRKLFDEIKIAFQGRIHELYLNIPGGQSADIRNNQAISNNPEAGRARHLHIALGGPGSPVQVSQTPAPVGVPSEGQGECVRSWQFPHLPWVEPNPHCWSDTVIYGASLAMIVVGGLMVSRGKET